MYSTDWTQSFHLLSSLFLGLLCVPFTILGLHGYVHLYKHVWCGDELQSIFSKLILTLYLCILIVPLSLVPSVVSMLMYRDWVISVFAYTVCILHIIRSRYYGDDAMCGTSLISCCISLSKCRCCRPHKVAAKNSIKMLKEENQEMDDVEAQRDNGDGRDHQIYGMDFDPIDGIEGVSEHHIVNETSNALSVMDYRQFPQIGYMDLEGGNQGGDDYVVL